MKITIQIILIATLFMYSSNIREAFLVNTALAWVDQQGIAYPIEHMLRFNGASEDTEIRFKKIVLTTLDSGAGTKQIS